MDIEDFMVKRCVWETIIWFNEVMVWSLWFKWEIPLFGLGGHGKDMFGRYYCKYMVWSLKGVPFLGLGGFMVSVYVGFHE